VIDYLKHREATSPNIGLAYIYCDYRDQLQQTTENIIGAITKQLLRQLPGLPEGITATWKKSRNGKEPLELAQAMEALSSACRSFNRTFICLDALDECRDIPKLLHCLHQAPSTVRIFGTGRKHVQPIIRNHFEHTQTIHIEAAESDIHVLVKERIKEDRKKDPSLMNEQLERCITERIFTLSKGMFVST
jgi:hypothetical protein